MNDKDIETFKAGGVAALNSFKNILQELEKETHEHIMDTWGQSGEETSDYLYARIQRLLTACSERTQDLEA